MEEQKSWYASTTIWGGAVAAVAGLAGIFGYTISPADQAASRMVLSTMCAGSRTGSADAVRATRSDPDSRVAVSGVGWWLVGGVWGGGLVLGACEVRVAWWWRVGRPGWCVAGDAAGGAGF